MVKFCLCIGSRVGAGRWTWISEVDVDSLPQEFSMLRWRVSLVDVLAAGLVRHTRAVRKSNDGLVIALDNRLHHSDSAADMRAGHVDLVQYVRATSGLMNNLRQPRPLDYVIVR